VTSTDKSMPAAPADSGGCGGFSVVAPQVNVMLDGPHRPEAIQRQVRQRSAHRVLRASRRGRATRLLSSLRRWLACKKTKETRPSFPIVRARKTSARERN